MEIVGEKPVMTPEGVFIIATYDEDGVPNAMNAAWGAQCGGDEIAFFLGKHKTTENLKATGAFTVSFATADTVEISDYFGIAKGAKVNKIEQAGVHVHKSKHVNAPIIEEYPLTLECTVELFDEEHGFLIGKVVSEQADESILTDGHVDLGKLRPIIFDPSVNGYRVVGEEVGKAWHDGMGLMKK